MTGYEPYPEYEYDDYYDETTGPNRTWHIVAIVVVVVLLCCCCLAAAIGLVLLSPDLLNSLQGVFNLVPDTAHSIARL